MAVHSRNNTKIQGKTAISSVHQQLKKYVIVSLPRYRYQAFMIRLKKAWRWNVNQMDATTSVPHLKVKNATQVGIATSWENVLEIKKV